LTFRTIDDFIIDRIFQPISDTLASLVSCYAIGAFLMTGGLMFSFAWDVQAQHWVNLFFDVTFGPLYLYWAHRMQNEPIRNVMPTNRIALLPVRIFLVVLCLFGSIPAIVINLAQGIWIEATHNFSGICMTAAFYFLACRRLPPTRRASSYARQAKASVV